VTINSEITTHDLIIRVML